MSYIPYSFMWEGVRYVTLVGAEIDDYLEGRDVSSTAADKIEGWYTRTQHKRHLPIAPLDTWWK